jgi:hypothetical protein
MAPKRITVVVDASGSESNESVGNDTEFRALIDDYAVRFLITANPPKIKIRGFESLVDGGNYTLGPPQQQQQQNGKSRCCSRILVFNLFVRIRKLFSIHILTPPPEWSSQIDFQRSCCCDEWTRTC